MLEHPVTGKALDRERDGVFCDPERERERARAHSSSSEVELEKIFGEGGNDGKADAKISIVRQGGKEEQNSSCKLRVLNLHWL